MSGTLGSLTTTAATSIEKSSYDTQAQLLYSVPTSGVAFASVSISAVNAGTETALLSVWIKRHADGNTTFTDKQLIEFKVSLAVGVVLERSGLLVSAGDKIYLKSSKAGVNINAYGIESS